MGAGRKRKNIANRNPLRLELTKKEIDRVFAERDKADWEKLIATYRHLRENILIDKNSEGWRDYERRFNYFYQVRRNAAWRADFYEVFFKYAKTGAADFAMIIRDIFEKRGMVEMSFASKLTGTIDPAQPIIDRHVLSFIDRTPPPLTRPAEERIHGIIQLHGEMKQAFELFLASEAGDYLLRRFEAEHPASGVSAMKQLDFVLWQSGGKK